MRVESDGHSQGNPRLYELIENAPKTGKSPTVWAWPEFVDFLKVAGQPVQGPWPPHQRPRPDPTAEEAGPVAVPDPTAAAPKATKAPKASTATTETAPQASAAAPTAAPGAAAQAPENAAPADGAES
jgi:hypothetical protein